MGDSCAQAWVWLVSPPTVPHLSKQPHVQTRRKLVPSQLHPLAAPGASPPVSGFFLSSAEVDGDGGGYTCRREQLVA